MKFVRIFKKNKNVIIGAIHLPPLPGYPKFPGFDVVVKNALADLKAFESGGVDGIIFENNYDLPHKISVDVTVVNAMKLIGKKLKKATILPIGISVLWNDYRAALSIAKELDLQFIRVPVFVDDVKTDYGIIKGEAKKVVGFRKSIQASRVALFTDIHVKHARLLSDSNPVTSARRAIENYSDAIIITGQWTGNAPRLGEVENLRKRIGKFPILVGSGLDKNNATKLFKFANGAIVSTSLKRGAQKIGERNVKSYQARIDGRKVTELVRSLRTLLVAATHGDEMIGVEALRRLKRDDVVKEDCLLIGNPKAFSQRKRYLEADLNRVFPGSKKSCVYEEKRAYEILEQARGYHGVVDVHGTDDETGIFVIVSNPTQENLALAEFFDVKNVVLWPSTSGRATGSLSQFVKCGIGIECGPQNSSAVRKKLVHVLRHYLTGISPGEDKHYFQVYGKLAADSGERKFRSFQEIEVNGEKFYPLLVNRYQKIKCYKMKRINPPRQ